MQTCDGEAKRGLQNGSEGVERGDLDTEAKGGLRSDDEGARNVVIDEDRNMPESS